MLRDTNMYKLLKSDPTYKYESLANSIVSELYKDSYISNHENKYLKRHNSWHPRLYGLRETQKYV